MDDYSTEPRLVFQELNARRYAECYAAEMDDFTDDVPFYTTFLNNQKTLLELGCGSGRLTRLLAAQGFRVTGLDISQHMIGLAQENAPDCSFHLADMTNFSLDKSFDAVILPYNTINLLSDKQAVRHTLTNALKHLNGGGICLTQIYIPSIDLTDGEQNRLFQFDIINTADGGKIIKEIIRSYSNKKKRVTLEERYRMRPIGKNSNNEDLSHTYEILGWEAEEWKAIFLECGFVQLQEYGGYDGQPFVIGEDTTLLLVFQKP